MSEAEEKEILYKLIEIRKEMNEGFNRMEERFHSLINKLDSIKEVAEGIPKK